MEDLAGLLFAVASVDRLTLFYTIGKERLRLTQLASKLSASTQETSRHLSRLQEAKIIERGPDGCFILTPFGKSLLVLLPSLKFLTRHKEYFLSHDISTLPLEFIERIGELEQGEYRHGVGDVLSHTADVFREAEKYAWLCSDNVMDLSTLGGKGAGEDVLLRIIVPTASIDEIVPETPRAELGVKVELRVIDRVNAGLAMNERRAGVTFPDLTGQIDFNGGFGSVDPNFHKWCADLFMFHWNKAKNV
jgi:predicted transcriptional regulator